MASRSAADAVIPPEPEAVPVPERKSATRKPRPRRETAGRSVSDPVNESAAPETDDGFIAPGPASIMREQAEQKRASRRMMSVGAMWLVTLSLLSAGALAAYVFRDSVVEKHPKTATLYKAFGVSVAKGGLVFGKVITRSAYVEGEPTLIVEGEVHNPGREVRNARLVQLSLHGPSGDSLTRWQVELPQETVDTGETLSFVTQFPNPPVDAVSLRYVFDGDADMPVEARSDASRLSAVISAKQ